VHNNKKRFRYLMHLIELVVLVWGGGKMGLGSGAPRKSWGVLVIVIFNTSTNTM
jgi:hypothetical protein